MTLADQCMSAFALVSFAKPRSNQSQLLGRYVTFPLFAEILPCCAGRLAASFDQTKSVLVPIRHRSGFDSARDETVSAMAFLRSQARASCSSLDHNEHVRGDTSIKD
jgi:hypothetical protein